MTIPFRKYQRRMIHAGIKNTHFMLGADMGLGKTLSFCEIIDQLMFNYFSVQRVVIVAPKRVAYETIPAEIEKWGYSRLKKHVRAFTCEDFGLERDTDRVLKSHPSRVKALRREIKGRHLFIDIVSRDHLHHYMQACGPTLRWNLVVLDESTSFSNPKAGRYQAARRMIKRADRVLLSTGTPVPDKAEQIPAQMFLLDRGKRLGDTLQSFRREYMEPDYTDGRVVRSWRLLPGSKQQIIEKIRDIVMILRTEDWLELPDRVVNWVEVELPPYARDLYDKVAAGLVAKVGSAEVFAVNKGVAHGKLQQIANGTVFETHEFETPQALVVHSAKLEALQEICEGHPGPLIIWYSHIPDRDRILEAIPGAVAAHSVRHLERDWNAGLISRLVAHPASIGHGMNMQHCPGSDEVWYGLPSSNEIYRQGLKRMLRSGRKLPVRSWRIMAKRTVESKILRTLGTKDNLEAAIKDALAETWDDYR